MPASTSEQRRNWAAYECEGKMTSIPFGPDRILVAPPTVDAWQALANVLLADGYDIRTPDTDSYNCREIKGGGGRSLHSYGIALDINWDTNPYKTTPDHRPVVFSNKATQRERAEDVRLGRADTDMTPGMINDVLAIRTGNGRRVFEWGGDAFRDRCDARGVYAIYGLGSEVPSQTRSAATANFLFVSTITPTVIIIASCARAANPGTDNFVTAASGFTNDYNFLNGSSRQSAGHRVMSVAGTPAPICGNTSTNAEAGLAGAVWP
jgi:hypothetical protein